MKIAEGKFHEEKLKLQQKHDADVQKVRSVCIFLQRQYINQNIKRVWLQWIICSCTLTSSQLQLVFF